MPATSIRRSSVPLNESPAVSGIAAILPSKAGPWILIAASALILFAMPGSANLWTMEGRSAVICREMMRTGEDAKVTPTSWQYAASEAR